MLSQKVPPHASKANPNAEQALREAKQAHNIPLIALTYEKLGNLQLSQRRPNPNHTPNPNPNLNPNPDRPCLTDPASPTLPNPNPDRNP